MISVGEKVIKLSLDLSNNFPPEDNTTLYAGAFYRNTILFGEKESSALHDTVKNFLESVKNFLEVAWSWIKYNLLSCFFDAEEEKRVHLEKEIDKFVHTYYQHEDNPENEKKIAKSYENLSKELREEIENKIKNILVEKFPQEKTKNLLKEVIKSPYKEIEDCMPMGQAIIETKEQLVAIKEEDVN